MTAQPVTNIIPILRIDELLFKLFENSIVIVLGIRCRENCVNCSVLYMRVIGFVLLIGL